MISIRCTADALLDTPPPGFQTLAAAPHDASTLGTNLSLRPPTPISSSRFVTTSMFEVPLERCSTNRFILEDSPSELPPRFIFYKSHNSTLVQKSRGVRLKKNREQKLGTQFFLPLHQALNPDTTNLFSRTLEPMAVFVSRTRGLKGLWGMSMAMAVAIAAFVAATRKKFFRDLNQLQENFCMACKGFGIQRCYLCKGHRIVEWEGKLQHSDPCPLCFGSCYTKCTTCGGVKSRKMK